MLDWCVAVVCVVCLFECDGGGCAWSGVLLVGSFVCVVVCILCVLVELWWGFFVLFFFSSKRRHTRFLAVAWGREERIRDRHIVAAKGTPQSFDV